ncbi:hypothetical protein AKJ65_07405 [candidate division MSBL1 archaeon SCGC-AAA259E19]|uniref:Uncharacterized protein n=1 Tax=candidate division MSBL1 archaeon SCGC-AAA259E19 TaxID=1698264 RepID=A0A133UE96_9EURY|nr:hypothetical protein AKJ65_07405 [candidate division MSBL1 archaeon SCGC-AAA259E19]
MAIFTSRELFVISFDEVSLLGELEHFGVPTRGITEVLKKKSFYGNNPQIKVWDNGKNRRA